MGEWSTRPAKFLCTLPSQCERMENIGGFLIVKCADGRDYIVTPEGQFREITGSVRTYREMARG